MPEQAQKQTKNTKSDNWSVYLILCSDQSLYCGISNDVERRFKQHQSGKGAKYFRGRDPVKIAYQLNNLSHSRAAQLEVKVKKLSKKQKLELVAGRRAI